MANERSVFVWSESSKIQESGIVMFRQKHCRSAVRCERSRSITSCCADLDCRGSKTQLTMRTVAHFRRTMLLVVVCAVAMMDWRNHQATMAFLAPTAFLTPIASTRSPRSYSPPPLWDGTGVATNYSWREDALEVEITVSVPPGTRAKNVAFKAKQRSIDLILKGEDGDKVLLDGNREMRGKVSFDGTYWVLSENEEDPKKQEITVTVEKNIRPGKDDFEVVEYDWKGVYPDDDEEVIERKYEEPEELNVREYAASLGVDIDNINMSKVDKTMFSSGLNMTRRSLDALTKAGYVEEVTQQADGKEFTENEEGVAVPFSMLGDKIRNDDMQDVARSGKIPFVDTGSPWHKTVPVADLDFDPRKSMNSSVTSEQETIAESSAADNAESEKEELTPLQASDPIDTLTVKRLKEVLREQGLKVSGKKQELRDRLRNHVRSLLQKEKKKSPEEQ